MIVVNEHDAVSLSDPRPGPLRRLKVATMWLPVLSYADGYGFTYGVRVGFVDPLGPHTRISVPLTWGGERRAAMDIERTFDHALVTRVNGSLATYQRVNPHYDVPDVRLEARGRVERVFTKWVRAGVNGRTTRVDFAGVDARHSAAGVDIALDTRLDPSFPRNAVHAVVGWERMTFEDGSAGRWLGDVRGYIGIGGSKVLALRAQFAHATAALPLSEQPLLGGSGSLRGYRTGHRAGDNLAALSAEVRVPLSSPLSVGRFGVKGFVDAGTTWPAAARLRDQAFDRGIGGGVYFGVAAFTIDVDVAWPEAGGARTHVGFGVTF
jgi:outer membrane protein assembly factor BamA